MTIDLTTRVDTLEKEVAWIKQQLNKSTFENSSKAIYLREKPERETNQVNLPVISNKWTHMHKLLSVQSVALQSAISGTMAFFVGGSVALFMEWSWHVPVASFLSVSSLSWLVLSLDRRGLLHHVVKGHALSGKNKNLNLKITVENDTNKTEKILDELKLNKTITYEQLAEYAKALLQGEKMTTHNWTGRGNLFSQGQYSNLIGQMEKFGYSKPGYSRYPKKLTKKGYQLMELLAKLA